MCLEPLFGVIWDTYYNFRAAGTRVISNKNLKNEHKFVTRLDDIQENYNPFVVC